jgi:hypothetical protein
MEWRFYDHTLTNTAEGRFNVLTWHLAVGTRRLRIGPKAKNLTKESATFFGASAMGRVGRIVEAPDRGNALFAILRKGGSHGVVIETFKHLLALRVLVVAALSTWRWAKRDLRCGCLSNGLHIVVVRGGVIVSRGMSCC